MTESFVMTPDRLKRLLGAVGFDPSPILGHPRFGGLSNRALCQMAVIAVISGPDTDLSSTLADYPVDGLPGSEFSRLRDRFRRAAPRPTE